MVQIVLFTCGVAALCLGTWRASVTAGQVAEALMDRVPVTTDRRRQPLSDLAHGLGRRVVRPALVATGWIVVAAYGMLLLTVALA